MRRAKEIFILNLNIKDFTLKFAPGSIESLVEFENNLNEYNKKY